MTAPAFSARIRWSDDRFPEWELETLHAGFPSPAAAAMYANKYPAGPDLLALERGVVAVVMTDGREVFPDETVVKVWRLQRDSDGDVQVVRDDDYSEVEASMGDLSRMGLDGIWLPRAWSVDGPDGPVGVSLIENEQGEVVVLVVDTSATDPLETDEPLLGVIPRG